jgi:hypothetical protein
MPLQPDAWPFIELAAAKSTARYVLGFKPEVISKAQKRFQGRYTLRPVIDLSEYTCRAVIDWIEFRVVLASRTQGRWIHEEIEDATGDRARADEEPGGIAGRQFKIRFQEPSLGQIKRALNAVAARWGIVGSPAITGLEISFDARPREHSEEALARMFGVLVRTHLPSRDVITEREDRPRAAWGTREEKDKNRHMLAYPRGKATPYRVDELLRRSDRDQMAPFDATYYAGAEKSRCAWRTMVKLIDQQNKATRTSKILQKHEQRVRLEVTLLEPELREIGSTSFEDLADFSFQKFQGAYFKFRLPTFEQTGLRSTEALQAMTDTIERERQRKFLTTGVLGLQAMDAVKRRERQATKEASKASHKPLKDWDHVGTGRFSTSVLYEALTKRVIHALRDLGRRQRESLRQVSKSSAL